MIERSAGAPLGKTGSGRKIPDGTNERNISRKEMAASSARNIQVANVQRKLKAISSKISAVTGVYLSSLYKYVADKITSEYIYLYVCIYIYNIYFGACSASCARCNSVRDVSSPVQTGAGPEVDPLSDVA